MLLFSFIEKRLEWTIFTLPKWLGKACLDFLEPWQNKIAPSSTGMLMLFVQADSQPLNYKEIEKG